ncbi:hypothetical protein CLV94_2121 [Flavobacterium endophyticum]|uniref:DUF2199 domain-containing protein n=1 Tax=Flavobacterium endophyticum TaxID=1540163 RepID=A0A495MB53_9FLAO|nr:DUF2199 domain-containing protein [Flavobacterium endophyticum]RKS23216.1 hypothetical protein CLV94_2121 [Flavobacterium endophyticum]
MKYICDCCGKECEDWPALAFSSPLYYDILPKKDKKEIAELSSDFCSIHHADQTDRFVRGVLFQKVNNHCEDLHYGLWVSFSEKSYQDYKDNFDNKEHEGSYFGWLCNDIPDYDFEESIPTSVYTRKGGDRPEIVPHKDFDHPFVRDYYNGVSKEEAENRIKAMLEKTTNKKLWWKFW